MTAEPRSEPQPRLRRLWAFLPRSLANKIVAGVVALVFLVVAAVGVGTYFELRSFLYNRLTTQLNSSVAAAAQSPCLAAPGSLTVQCHFGSALRTGQHVWINVLGSDGSVLVASGASSNADLTVLSIAQNICDALVAHPGRQYSVTVAGESLRVTAAPLAGGDDFVVIGLSAVDVENTLHQLIAKELLIGAAAILVALGATTYGVNRSLRGLKRVTETATGVAAELSPEGTGLDRRVPVVEEGTEVGQLAQSMNTLLAAVETQFAARVESENRMRQFLADASHELRTPLTSIRGYAELARMQRAAGSADEDNLGRIEAEGTRMSRLVEDLLMLARGDHDSIPRIELIDIADTVDDAVSGVRAANPERSIMIEPIPSYHVVGDPDQLVRVIRNLLTNATVHTPAESPIRVRAFVDGPGIAIQVIDGGPGLAPEEAEHVFERFWRADKARTRARGGSGLGLSIVASIVHAHQGATHFESTVVGGSTVTVWLPGVTA